MATCGNIGAIIEGTHKLDALLEAFALELEALAREEGVEEQKRALIAEARVEALHARNLEEERDVGRYVLEELEEELNAYAPPYCYFGAHEGDGASFGYWVDIGAVEEGERVGEIVRAPDGASYVLGVNDHGNATLYHVGRSVWGVV